MQCNGQHKIHRTLQSSEEPSPSSFLLSQTMAPELPQICFIPLRWRDTFHSEKMQGITCMDAALDAMRPLGFRTQLILRTVNELLDVYGGNQGWCFIEEAYYKLLMEARRYHCFYPGRLVDSKISWRGNSALKDGSQAKLDLSKGMYDARDNMKFGFPMAFMATVLSWSILEYGDQMDHVGQLDAAQDSLKWITDFLINAHPSENVLYIQAMKLDKGFCSGQAIDLRFSRLEKNEERGDKQFQLSSAGPLYRVITIAPETVMTVPMTLATLKFSQVHLL
ncbi:hypothetical protein JHK86_006457 [Glycine max]|nr:hypothetical protein JHK86_006457 [Glycine max]